MTTTALKIEYLSIIYKAVPLTGWQQSYTSYKVADSVICAALNWALADSESGIASDLEDGEAVSVGQQFQINITPPSSKLGFKVYNDKNEFLQDNPTEVARDCFVISELFFSRDKDEDKPDWFKNYQSVLPLVTCLQQVAVHYQNAQIIFVDNKKKFELPIVMEEAAIDGLPKSELDKLLDFLQKNSLHSEQKNAIFADAVIELVKLEPLNDRFSYLLLNLKTLNQKILYSYNLFCTEFSYEKFKEKLTTSRLDDFAKAHKIFADIQNQILGIPAATFIVATQMKQVSNGYASPEFWANTGIFAGCVIYAILMLCTLNNQSETASVIKNEIDRQKDKVKKELNLDDGTIPKDIQELFTPLDKRIKHQKGVICFLQWVVSLALFACMIAYIVRSI